MLWSYILFVSNTVYLLSICYDSTHFVFSNNALGTCSASAPEAFINVVYLRTWMSYQYSKLKPVLPTVWDWQVFSWAAVTPVKYGRYIQLVATVWIWSNLHDALVKWLDLKIGYHNRSTNRLKAARVACPFISLYRGGPHKLTGVHSLYD